MLLRNLSPEDGLCNGTRLICTSLSRYVLGATIITGTHAGEQVFLPRIPICPSDLDMPFKFRRLQFLIRPAFAITINKAQGQTLDTVGIYLKKPVFSHGQLYVALSRVTSHANVHVLLEDLDTNTPHGCTTNVVHPEILA
jgi:ATP-dependent DNA helicase PIF1